MNLRGSELKNLKSWLTSTAPGAANRFRVVAERVGREGGEPRRYCRFCEV